MQPLYAHFFSCTTQSYYKTKGSCGGHGDALSRSSFKAVLVAQIPLQGRLATPASRAAVEGKLQLAAPSAMSLAAENFLVQGHILTNAAYIK